MKSHYAQYGNNIIPRAYCPKCQLWSMIIDGMRQCCDEVFEDYGTRIKVVVPARKKRLQLRRKQKNEILEIQHGRCFYCNNELGYYYERNFKVFKSTTHFDHILPFCYSYNNNQRNFVASCNLCNSIKGSKMFKNIKELRNHINERRIKKGIEIIDTDGYI